MIDLFRFIGEDKSMDYRTDKVYMLELSKDESAILEPRYCLYSSWETFFQNWERA